MSDAPPAPLPPSPASARAPVHFVGIAGAGMSALAELLARRGVTVTGCDAHPDAVADLEGLGIAVASGHDPRHVEGAREVIVTSAVPRDHPELEHARALGIPVVRRAEALARAVSVGEVVAIAGTHGKTTTTVMTTEALAAAGRQPTGIAGGRVGAWSGNLRPGGDALFVVEADEYDRSFLALQPTVAVITNVEADHLDIYTDLGDIRAAFATFAAGARTVVVCADDPGAQSVPLPTGADVVRYGLTGAALTVTARALRPSADSAGSRFVLIVNGVEQGEVVLPVPGRHNVLNALGALAAGWSLDADLDAMARGLGAFAGVERRFQRLGDAAGVTVVDDYAHHPTEIRATVQAARTAFPSRRLVVAFQPHLFSRTRDFAQDFGAALALGDAIFLTDIYPAREQPIPGVTAALVADAARAAGGTLAWRGERAGLADALAAFVRRGDVVLTMGAGDVTRTGAELLERLSAHR